jgi:hypothetical protein
LVIGQLLELVVRTLPLGVSHLDRPRCGHSLFGPPHRCLARLEELVLTERVGEAVTPSSLSAARAVATAAGVAAPLAAAAAVTTAAPVPAEAVPYVATVAASIWALA